MKKIVALGVSTLLSLSFVATSIATAETTMTTQNTPPTKPATTGTTQTTTTSTADSKALAERIAKRKTDLKTKLTNAEKVKIQSKCKASQGLVSSVKGRINGVETSRTQVNKNLVSRLTDLSAKLKNKGVNTAGIDAEIANLQTLINTFNADLLIYKQAVSDLVDIDCATDPDGFKASLEASRAAQAVVSKDAAAIRTKVNDVIKPLLKTIRAQLEASKTEGSN